MDNKRTILYLLIAVILCGSFVYFLNHFILKKEEIIIQNSSGPECLPTSLKTTTKEVYVHISGAVNNPGVYKLKKEMRAIEAVNIAGGYTLQADLDSVNMAEKIKDGQKIHIPNKIYELRQEKTKTTARKKHNKKRKRSKNALNIRININSATEKDFQKLPGVGPSLSKKILTYRSSNGSFKTIKDLLKVPGIGKKKMEKIGKYICL